MSDQEMKPFTHKFKRKWKFEPEYRNDLTDRIAYLEKKNKAWKAAAKKHKTKEKFFESLCKKDPVTGLAMISANFTWGYAKAMSQAVKDSMEAIPAEREEGN